MSAKGVQNAEGVWMSPPGHEALWNWFGLSRASWLAMPRVLMHEMPDEWQAKMAELLHEWDATWDTDDCPTPRVQAEVDGQLAKWPEWLLQYRHPDLDIIEAHRAKKEEPST